MDVMEAKRVGILDLSYIQLKEWLKSIGEPVNLADQISKLVYRDLASTFEEMTDLPSTLKQKLIESTTLTTLKPILEKASADGQTRKLLFGWMTIRPSNPPLCLPQTRHARERRTVCLSSQVGCPIGCGFCSTGQQGFERNLRTGEMIEQVLFYRQLPSPTPAILLSPRGRGIKVRRSYRSGWALDHQCGIHGHGRTLIEL
jgi:23S rRNA (adenine2503-C2)-methyltransferase